MSRKRCHRRRIILSVVTCFSLFYCWFYKMKTETLQPNRRHVNNLTNNLYEKSREHELKSNIVRQKLVILLTNKRSGSSYVGEIFARNPAVFYLFEPLYPFTRLCNVLQLERVDALKEFLNCHFEALPKLYKEAFKITKKTDEFAKCIDNNICFLKNYPDLKMKKYRTKCLHSSPRQAKKRCSLPLNTTIMSDMCFESRLVVYKILRICEMRTLKTMLDEFEERNDVEVKIIHLIRDPRAILSSRLNLPLDTTSVTLKRDSTLLCSGILTNIQFADTYWRDDMTQTSSYLRVFYENIVEQPLKAAQEMYKFLGEPFPEEIGKWIQTDISNFTKEDLQHPKAFSTQRKNAFNSVDRWRDQLTADQIQIVKGQCDDVLKKLSYK